MNSTATQVEVKERPAIFSGPMVRGILAEAKTQARCAITDERAKTFAPGYADDRARIINLCPYGNTGDRLWVREALRWTDWLRYEADNTPVDADRIPANVTIGKDYLFARLMPRWASRIVLEITNVRTERLQDLSCTDVLAEGSPIPLREHSNPELGIQCVSAKEWFSEAWDKLNAKRGYSWASNPFVWVIDFKKL